MLIGLSPVVSFFPWNCFICCFCPDKDEDDSIDEDGRRNDDPENGQLLTPTAPEISDFCNSEEKSKKLLGVQIISELSYLVHYNFII